MTSGRRIPVDQCEPRACAIPSASRIGAAYTNPDLADAYEITLPPEATRDPETLARFVFARQAGWVRIAMRMRDAVMARFGLKTARRLRADPVGRVGIFRIYDRSDDEIVLGEDDRHLDFRVALRCVTRTSDAGSLTSVTLSTVVRCHNRLGRIYLTVIGPVHRQVVQSFLRRAARLGWPTRVGPAAPSLESATP